MQHKISNMVALDGQKPFHFKDDHFHETVAALRPVDFTRCREISK